MATPRSSSRVFSSRAWLMPPMDGEKIIAAGMCLAISAASWSAPLAARAGPGDLLAGRGRPGARRRRSARSSRSPLRDLAAARRRPLVRAASRVAGEHPRQRTRLGVTQVHRQLGPAGHRGDDPGLQAHTPVVPTPPSALAISSTASAVRRRGKAGIVAHVHRGRAGVRGLAAEDEAMTLDPGAAAHRGHAIPSRSSTGPCSMCSSR